MRKSVEFNSKGSKVRGVLVTPFHNMMLISPATTLEQVNELLGAFGACIEELQQAS